MLWTIFMIAMIIWMVGLGLHFGGTVIPLLLVVAVAMLLGKHIFRHRSFN